MHYCHWWAAFNLHADREAMRASSVKENDATKFGWNQFICYTWLFDVNMSIGLNKKYSCQWQKTTRKARRHTHTSTNANMHAISHNFLCHFFFYIPIEMGKWENQQPIKMNVVLVHFILIFFSFCKCIHFIRMPFYVPFDLLSCRIVNFI